MGPPLEENPLGLSEELRSSILDNLSEGVYIVDRQRRILYWNRGSEEITGYSAPEVLGRSCRERLLDHCDENGRMLCGDRCPLLAAGRDGQTHEVRMYLHHKDGSCKPVHVRAAPSYNAAGELVGAVETFHDDSALVASRRRARDMERASMSDPLTGVGNRRLGEALMVGWLEQYRQFDRMFGLLFVDIDRFKGVNDRFGHEVGDEALRAVARTLAQTSRDQDEVVRWGGEEFLVLMADANAATLAAIAARMRAIVKQVRLAVGGRQIHLTVSIGGTLVAPGDTPELIVARADALMYRSKNGGRDTVTLDAAPERGPGPEPGPAPPDVVAL